MSKVCLIRQPAGLGDILFLQKVGHTLKSQGYHVIWPVISEYKWVKDYITDFEFPCIDDDFQHKEIYGNGNIIDNDSVLFLPLQDADRLVRGKIMACKYNLINMPFDDWDDYLKFERNMEKENELYTNILDIKEDENYVLVSRNYGSPPHSEKFPMNIQTDLRIIELDYYDGFTLFDWCKVIENASGMYLIDSSINFIIDKLTTKCENIHLWSRRPNNWSEINYIFKTKYNLMN